MDNFKKQKTPAQERLSQKRIEEGVKDSIRKGFACPICGHGVKKHEDGDYKAKPIPCKHKLWNTTCGCEILPDDIRKNRK